jgi:hypothetical protein
VETVITRIRIATQIAIALCAIFVTSSVALAQGALTNGATQTGVIQVGGLDTWTFQAAYNDSITLSVGEVVGSGPEPYFNPWIRLRGPDGASLGDSWGSNAAQIDVRAPLAGTYTVLVANKEAGYTQAGPGSYVLTLAKTPGPYTVSSGDEGGPMTNGVTHTGVIGVGDLDPWTFQAAYNDSITLSVGEVVGSGPEPYFNPWIRLRGPDGAPLGDNWGSNAAQIAVRAPLAGTYTVLVANRESGYTQAGPGEYTLKVTGLTATCTSPSIAGQPLSQSIQSGQTATFSVSATGTTLSYQWYQGSSGDTSQPVGTNASSFTTPALTATTSYWVRVSNSCGHADSVTATITVGSAYSYAVWVPVASHNSGLYQSQWRSDLGLLNTGTVTANVQIKFFGSGGVVSSTTYVSPQVQSILTDIVGQLGASGSGALEILSDQPLKVTARTYNQVSSAASCYPNGTQGQDYPAVVASDGLAAGQSAYLAGLSENASYRCNIGVVNVGSGVATVLVELYNGAGTKLTDYTVSLAAGQWAQDTQPFKNTAAQTAMDRGYAKITVQTGSGVFGFASVVNNITNDPTTVAMQR